MKKKVLFSLLWSLALVVPAQITVSKNGHYLTQKNGSPFFWLGDTDWELFHRLTREEVIQFLNTRKEQGFNVIQAVALAEFEGLRKPNRYGDYPLIHFDPTRLAVTPGSNPSDSSEYDYWDHVDFVIREAAKRNMYIGLLPTWGDKVTANWGDGPKIFDSVNAEIYAETLAKRYAKQWNIIWILGGDRPAVYTRKIDGTQSTVDDRPIWRAMARGIQKILGSNVFITYHPSGGEQTVTSQYLQQETWLSMNAMQTGHGAREADVWNWVAKDYQLQPAKPTLDMEPCYEDHPVNPWDGKWTRQRGYFFAYDVRLRIYRGIFAGTCGVTYGDHQVWQFLDTTLNKPINIGDTIIGWKKALHSEAATQLKSLKKLMLSRPYFSRIPDQRLILSDAGSNYIDYISATRDADGSYAMIHLPLNKEVKIDLSKITGSIKNIFWFDPRTGSAKKMSPVQSTTATSFIPPMEGKDWILIIDDASKHYAAP
jgi:hypothetical protein